jgi:proton glutamate symport protein
MSFSTGIVLSLVAGLVTGMVIGSFDVGALAATARFLEPVGTLWLNALRMVVIPMVIALLITGAASATETASAGRLTARSLVLFVVLLSVTTILCALFVPAILAWWPVDPVSAAALRGGAGSGQAAIPELPPIRDWITTIVPANPFAAASDGAILPLVIFALLFGFAASRIPSAARESLLGFFKAVVDTMFVLVRWILKAAPVGVFVLALGVGMRGGVGAASAITHYLILICAICVVVTVLMYPLAIFGGDIPLARFARTAAPAQAVAISTQSSLASLPAMLEGAQTLVPRRVAAITLPMAVTLFRITSPVVNLGIVIFVAHVYGVHLGAAQLAAGTVVAVITNFAVVGLPSQITFFNTTVPISLTMGVPVDILPLLLAVEVIPDLFRTIGNVTADLAVTTVLARSNPDGLVGV